MTVHSSVMYDVHDFKVYRLLTDTTGSATYGSAVDVPGIAEVSLEPNFVTAELKGDATIIARRGRIDQVNLSATYGKLSLDVLAVILGGTVTDGVGEASYSLGGANTLQYFKAAFVINDADVGQVEVTLYKAQLTGGTLLGQSSDNFGQPTMDVSAIPTTADATQFFRVRFLDTPGTL